MRRILTSCPGAWRCGAALAVLPRLGVLAHERGRILTAFVEKSDTFAQTLASSGTYGFIPGIPSAYTQPLYGWFLAALYWPLERHWLVVGIAQTLVAAATALVVLYTGRRFLSARAGLIAALISTLHPYLVWHDVHVNREILDAVLLRLARGARVVISGAISQYNATEVPPGPANYMQLLVMRASMAGFVIFDYAPRFPEAGAKLAGWLDSGELRSREDVVHAGIEQFPEVLLRLFRGENTGKLVMAL